MKCETYSDDEYRWDQLHVAPDLDPDVIDRLVAEDDPDVDDDDTLASFRAVDVSAFRAGGIELTMPTTMRTSDGVGLLYTDRLNYIFSGPGAGKSWALAYVVREKIENSEAIAVIDVEDTLAPLLERLTQIGVDPVALDRYLLFIHPAAPFTTAAVELVIDQMVERGAVHACLDSLGEAFALEGVGENNDDQVGPWVGGVLRRIINQTGAGVTVVDHSTNTGAKDGELRPSGSKRKTAGVTGASWFVKVIKPFVKGQGGKVQFICAKDRHGNFRRGDACAEMEMAYVLDECLLTLTRLGVGDHLDDARSDFQERKYQEVKATIIAVLRAHQRVDDPLSKSALIGKVRDKMKASTSLIGDALESLLHADAEHPDPPVIETAGPRNSRLFHAAEVEGWTRE